MCNEILIPVITSLVTSSLITLIASKFFLTKDEKTIPDLKQFEFFIQLSKDLDDRFTAYMESIKSYMDSDKENKTELINSFESFISTVQDVCILKLDNGMTNNQFLKFKGFIKEIVDLEIIQKYYKCVEQEFKEENYATIFKVYKNIVK